MDLKTTRVGFVCLGASEAPSAERLRRTAEHSRKYIQKQEPFELIATEGMVWGREGAAAAADLFRRSGIDALVIQHATFAPDSLTLELISGLNVPIAVWGLPEPPFDGSARWCGSMSSLLMHTSALTHRGRRFNFVFGDPDSASARKALDGFLKAAAVRRTLRSCTIGLLSHRGPGFHTAGIDSFTLKEMFGPVVLYVDAAALARIYGRITDADTQRDLAQCQAEGWANEVDSADLLRQCIRSYLAICAMQREQGLDALSTHRPYEGIPPAESGVCLAQSRLTNQGLMTNTDDDLSGLLTMIMQHLLTMRPVFSAEWVQLDERANQILFWNPSGGPASLANPRLRPAMRRIYSGLDCVTVEFPLKPGDVTMARLIVSRGRYRLLVARGRAVEIDPVMRGACVSVKFERDVNDILRTILDNGFPHRYALVYQDVAAELSELAGMLGIDVITT